MKKPFEMSFADFAETIKPSGAVNRSLATAGGSDVFSYSVYMNGPLAMELPVDAQDFQFKDVMVYAMTEKLGLNSGSFRDNLKTAELVAIRSAWTSSVLERESGGKAVPLADHVNEDFEILAQGMVHPWIVNEIKKQKVLSLGLQPALDSAGRAMGQVVSDRAPSEISTGKVVSSNTDFTVQSTLGGEVVTHENRRLGSVPEVGKTVTVAYYRGNGQVFENLENLKVSAPFIDKESGDIAVSLVDDLGAAKQVVLFSGIAPFAKFVDAQGLDASLVGKAIDAREATPKVVPMKNLPKRELVGEIFVDPTSGCLAQIYQEKGHEHTVLFASSNAMAAYAKDFGLDSSDIALAEQLEAEQRLFMDKDGRESLTVLKTELAKLGVQDVIELTSNDRRYMGKIVDVSDLHVAQDIGRNVVVIHDKRDLDKAPNKGDRMTVSYENGRGRVDDVVKVNKDLAR